MVHGALEPTALAPSSLFTHSHSHLSAHAWRRAPMTQPRRCTVATATPRPPRRRSRCVPWLGATTAALGGCAYACWPSPPAASHPLQPIRRVRERDLDVPTFVDTYVLPRVPVIVELEAPERTERTVLAALRGACRNEPITLLSAIMAEFVDGRARATAWRWRWRSPGGRRRLRRRRGACGGGGAHDGRAICADRRGALPAAGTAVCAGGAGTRARLHAAGGRSPPFGLGLSSSRSTSPTRSAPALPGCMAEVLAALCATARRNTG